MNRPQTYVTIAILLVGLVLSMFVLRTPIPNMDDDTEFNTLYALETIAAISEEPHSVYDLEEHEEVRLYLRNRLIEYLGVQNVDEYTYDNSLVTEEDIDYNMRNILAVIPGESETAILIVGHYDSRGHIGRTGELGNSYGAADDGYAMATILEIARLYADRELENTIYLLLTDAEETGLYGAHFAAQEDFMDNVGFVINIEARGVTGPAYMFETSTNNAKVIDFYTNADMPVSYSLATAVYTVMPNSTDFTEFLAVDKNGINFAVLDGLEYYHTPLDNYTNVDASSIAHYGRQIIPLVEEFVTNEKYSDIDYFDGTQNKVFFNVFSNVFVHYTDTVATIMHIVLMIGALGLVGYILYSTDLTFRDLGKGALRILGALVVAILAGMIVGRIVAFVANVPFDITYVRTTFGGWPTLLTLLGLEIGFAYWYNNETNASQQSVLIVGTLLNLTLALLSGFALSGASFLFLVPGLIGVLVLTFNAFPTPKWSRQIVYGVLLTLGHLVLIPILYSLYLAITVGGLLAFGVILVFYLIVMIPLLDRQLAL